MQDRSRGAVYGFATQVEIVPEKQVGVAAVAALDGANGVVGRLADYALRLMIAADEGSLFRITSGRPCRAKSDWPSGADHVGPMGKATVQVLGNRAFLHRGVFRNELRVRERDGRVVIDDVFSYGSEVEFDAAQTLRIGKSEYRKRSDDLAPPDAKGEWKELIGEYGWDHNTLFILEDQGNLVALIEWFYSYPLKQVGPDEFAFPDTGLYHGEKIVFDRDASGRVVDAIAAGVKVHKREVGTKNGETFRIEPVLPIDELRRDALEAEPPKESGEIMKSELTELVKLDPTIRLDVRYASTNNFAGAVFYDQPRAFCSVLVAEAASAFING
ncbi:MAG: hypothetical protein U0892_16945 [Pirellulales bacterium]